MTKNVRQSVKEPILTYFRRSVVALSCHVEKKINRISNFNLSTCHCYSLWVWKMSELKDMSDWVKSVWALWRLRGHFFLCLPVDRFWHHQLWKTLTKTTEHLQTHSWYQNNGNWTENVVINAPFWKKRIISIYF